MDSHETNLTGDDEIVVTKTIRSVSGMEFFRYQHNYYAIFLTRFHTFLTTTFLYFWF